MLHRNVFVNCLKTRNLFETMTKKEVLFLFLMTREKGLYLQFTTVSDDDLSLGLSGVSTQRFNLLDKIQTGKKKIN